MRWINNKDVNITELKQFALTMSWAIPCLFMLILPWIFERSVQFWPLYTSGVLISLYIMYPKMITPIYTVWMIIAGLIGWLNTRIILASIFYIIIFPIGILLRLFGKLQYRTSESETVSTYWKIRNLELKKEDLERPF